MRMVKPTEAATESVRALEGAFMLIDRVSSV
jgi:hypothetical protein